MSGSKKKLTKAQLEQMTVVDLRSIASARKTPGRSKAKRKAKLIDLLLKDQSLPRKKTPPTIDLRTPPKKEREAGLGDVPHEVMLIMAEQEMRKGNYAAVGKMAATNKRWWKFFSKGPGKRLYDIAKFLHQNHIKGKPHDITVYAEKGRLDVLQWVMNSPKMGIKDLRPDIYPDDALDFAATAGHLDVVKWIMAYPGMADIKRLQDPLRFAAAAGHLDVVKWILAYPGMTAATVYDSEAIPPAIKHGKWEVVLYIIRWMEQQGSSFYLTYYLDKTLRAAAAAGRLDVIKEIMSFPEANINKLRNANALEIAAMYMHWDVVKWIMAYPGMDITDLRANGNKVLAHAFRRGGSDAVEWIMAYPGMGIKDLQEARSDMSDEVLFGHNVDRKFRPHVDH
jgi:hypothetical protein